MADNDVLQSAAPATLPAGLKVAFRSVPYSGDAAEAIAPTGLVVFTGADDAKVAVDVSAAAPLPVASYPVVAGGGSDYHKVSVNSNNAAAVKAAPGQVYGIQG